MRSGTHHGTFVPFFVLSALQSRVTEVIISTERCEVLRFIYKVDPVCPDEE